MNSVDIEENIKNNIEKISKIDIEQLYRSSLTYCIENRYNYNNICLKNIEIYDKEIILEVFSGLEKNRPSFKHQ
jgi:hypothetical protein